MTPTQAAKAILADEAATPREKRYALAILERANAARSRSYDEQCKARQAIASEQLMIGRAA